MTDDDVHLTFDVAVTGGLEEVWRLLTTGEGRAAWAGTWAELDARPGGTSRVGWGDTPPMAGEVTAVEPLRRLVITYVADGEATAAEEWLLSHDAGVTHIRLIQTLPAPPDEGWEGFYGDIERGWRIFLESLRHAVEGATTPLRTVECRLVPAPDGRAAAWARVAEVLEVADAAPGATVTTPWLSDARVALVEPEGGVLLTTPARTLLVDLEGGDDLSAYVQAAVHDPPGDPDGWVGRTLDDLVVRLGGG